MNSKEVIREIDIVLEDDNPDKLTRIRFLLDNYLVVTEEHREIRTSITRAYRCLNETR